MHNKLCYVDWAITAHKKIQQAQQTNFFIEKSNKVSKYRKSIVNVIGHAIADCVTHQNKFAHTKDDGEAALITFKTHPTKYSREQWNAVILYNLVEQILHNDDIHNYTDDINDAYTLIKDNLLAHYQNSGIDNLEGKLEQSIRDIKKYDEQLNLAKEIFKFIPSADPKEMLETAHSRIDIKELNNRYDKAISADNYNYKDKEIDISLTNERRNDSPTREVTIGSQQDGAPLIKYKATLAYTPTANSDEQWSLSHDSEINYDEEVGFCTLTPYLQTIDNEQLNYFIQFVECDLELDASYLRDYKYWIKHKTEEYIGKKVKIGSVYESADPDYRLTRYTEEIQNEKFRKEYYTNYRLIDPHERPMPIED